MTSDALTNAAKHVSSNIVYAHRQRYTKDKNFLTRPTSFQMDRQTVVDGSTDSSMNPMLLFNHEVYASGGLSFFSD